MVSGQSPLLSLSVLIIGWSAVTDSPNISWKRRPSEIRGYMRTLYMTAENGDYLRVDYSSKEKRVRLYVEVQNEGGSPYYAVIKDGKITIERSVLSGRSSGFSDKFKERAHLFSTITNKDILRIINNNYGISQEYKTTVNNPAHDAEHKKQLEETRKRYFVQEKNPYGTSTALSGSIRGHIRLIDFIDFAAGWGLAMATFFYFQYSFTASGIISALFGILIGFVDMFLRERQPLFIKIIFFVVAGAASYVYGYYIL